MAEHINDTNAEPRGRLGHARRQRSARARCALLLLLSALLVTACGAGEPSATARANEALLDRAPVYPGATAPKSTADDAFASRDWTLPAGTRAATVIDWYVAKLHARGWKVLGKSFDTIRAKRGAATLSVGVRARTLELIASA
jgi:hypothetical protein